MALLVVVVVVVLAMGLLRNVQRCSMVCAGIGGASLKTGRGGSGAKEDLEIRITKLQPAKVWLYIVGYIVGCWLLVVGC